MPPSGRGTRAGAFGLAVRADRRIPFLESTLVQPTHRTLDLLVHDESRGPEWPQPATTICSREHRGSQTFRIEAHSDAGYLVWGRERGTYLLSADARELNCEVRAPPEVWERFLVGQVLPLAALVAGLEIFHASAVVCDGVAIAFAGPSGAGKTSLALAMCDRGACFLADDVVALEPAAGELLAHPGTPIVGLDHREATLRSAAGRSAPSEILASDRRERVVRVRTSPRAASLGVLFFLERQRGGPPEPRFEPVSDPLMLLTATFNFVLATEQRLRGLLDVCALIARRRVERIVADRSLTAAVLAAAVEQRLSGAE